MKEQIRALFSFTSSERSGTTVLLFLILITLVFICIEPYIFKPEPEDFSRFNKQLAAMDDRKNADTFLETHLPKKSTKEKDQVSEQPAAHESLSEQKQLFNFDPNGLPPEDWVKLGLSPAQARVVKNYEEKGGKFISKEDVKKLFVISEEKYTELEPYIVLPEKKEEKFTENKSRKPTIIELNTADSTLLVQVNGIGPAFAKRILSYRERLGGFHHIEQLTEVYGIDEAHFQQMQPFLKTDSTYIRKMNVNTATVADLKKHPYIGPAVAQALVNYRKQHGSFKTLVEIQGCHLVNADLYRKIAPYLSI
jgi:competence protein ComEA